MASIRKEISIDAPAADVWAAVRDVGAAHERLAKGFVTDTRLDEEARVVTFANGMIVRELIVDIDDDARRLAYAAVGERAAHHNASIQIYPERERRARIVWITDLLPHSMAEAIAGMMEQGAVAMKRTLERGIRV